jgi:hypothetical protein
LNNRHLIAKDWALEFFAAILAMQGGTSSLKMRLAQFVNLPSEPARRIFSRPPHDISRRLDGALNTCLQSLVNF